MNNSDHEKEAPRQFKPELGRTVTYGLPVFVSVHVLGMFTDSFEWIWHVPPLLSFFSSLGMGFVLHWLVFSFGPSPHRKVVDLKGAISPLSSSLNY